MSRTNSKGKQTRSNQTTADPGVKIGYGLPVLSSQVWNARYWQPMRVSERRRASAWSTSLLHSTSAARQSATWTGIGGNSTRCSLSS
eukprot:scaffold159784_cov17-Tisochrysis_lutea.AAC.1